VISCIWVKLGEEQLKYSQCLKKLAGTPKKFNQLLHMEFHRPVIGERCHKVHWST